MCSQKIDNFAYEYVIMLFDTIAREREVLGHMGKGYQTYRSLVEEIKGKRALPPCILSYGDWFCSPWCCNFLTEILKMYFCAF